MSHVRSDGGGGDGSNKLYKNGNAQHHVDGRCDCEQHLENNKIRFMIIHVFIDF